MAIIYHQDSWLYHYTSFNALSGILKERSLWATDLRFVNDSTEFRHATDMLSTEIEHRLQVADVSAGESQDLNSLKSRLVRVEPPPAYVFSMSKEKNDLSQWRAYSGAGGVAIGFDRDELAAVAKGFELVECEYRPDKQRELIAGFVDDSMGVIDAARSRLSEQEIHDPATGVFNTKIRPRFTRLAVTLKHPDFAAEKETRLAHVPASDDLKDLPEISCRPGKAILIPHMTIKLSEARRPLELDVLAGLRSVTAGPNFHRGVLLHEAIRAAFFANGLHARKIQWSETPYRAAV